MPIAAIGVGLGTALAGGAAAGASIYGAHKTASAADNAAQLQVNAANHAADLQKQSNDEALAFQKQQARRDYDSAESTRRANYDQWAARESRLGTTLGTLLGLGPREIPAYVPLPAYDAAAPTASPATANPSAAPTPAGTVLMQAPDGSTRPVPANQVAHYQQRGAKVVGPSANAGSIGAYVRPMPGKAV